MSVPKHTDFKHPDAVFGADAPSTPSSVAQERPSRGSTPPTLITEEIAALAASLGLETGTGARPYEPDAFVAAIQAAHDKLMGVKATLTRQNEEQRVLARTLAEREQAVRFREERIAAYEKLMGVEAPRLSFWRRVFG